MASSQQQQQQQQQQGDAPTQQRRQQPEQPRPSALLGGFRGSAGHPGAPIPLHVLDQEYDMVHQVCACAMRV
jgi:hypothetical protein